MVLAMSNRALAPLDASAVPDDVALVPVPGRALRGLRAPTRDVDVVAYAGNPEKKRARLRARRMVAGAARRRDAGRRRHRPARRRRDGVQIAGRLAPADYRALLRRARVFVAAPRREDYGIAPLEALADGCMLVTTPAPGAVSGARPRQRSSIPGWWARISCRRCASALDDPAAVYAAARCRVARAVLPPGRRSNRGAGGTAQIADNIEVPVTFAFIPSPSQSGFHLGPLDVHVYGLMYVLAVLAAVLITRRRWRGGRRGPGARLRGRDVGVPGRA